MFYRLKFSIARLLLVTMLATFLSPSLGWGMMTSHTEAGHGHSHHADFAWQGEEDDHHALPHEEPADHQDAHSSIGHLLSHMPAHIEAPVCIAISPGQQPRLSLVDSSAVKIGIAPPLRPPKPATLS